MTEASRRSPAVVAWSALGVLAALVALVMWLAAHRPAGLPPLDASVIVFLAKFVCPAPVGALIISRRPYHAAGWAMLAIGLAAATGGALGESARQFYEQHPDTGAVLFITSDALFKLTFFLVGVLMLVFPTGHPPSPRWWWPARAALVALGLETLREFTAPGAVADYLISNPPIEMVHLAGDGGSCVTCCWQCQCRSGG